MSDELITADVVKAAMAAAEIAGAYWIEDNEIRALSPSKPQEPK